jgi:hypothetical protein
LKASKWSKWLIVPSNFKRLRPGSLLLTIDENLHKYRIDNYLYHDTCDERLISYPYKIMSNIDGCISVIDLLANRIVTLDHHGKQKWIYDGLNKNQVTHKKKRKLFQIIKTL